MESAMKSLTTPNNHVAGARRIADKAKRDEFQQLLAKLDPEYATKLRYDCMRMANAANPKADPHAVVREAQKTFEEAVRFLLTKESAS
jgi:hypothetical protein